MRLLWFITFVKYGIGIKIGKYVFFLIAFTKLNNEDSFERIRSKFIS